MSMQWSREMRDMRAVPKLCLRPVTFHLFFFSFFFSFFFPTVCVRLREHLQSTAVKALCHPHPSQLQGRSWPVSTQRTIYCIYTLSPINVFELMGLTNVRLTLLAGCFSDPY